MDGNENEMKLHDCTCKTNGFIGLLSMKLHDVARNLIHEL